MRRALCAAALALAGCGDDVPPPAGDAFPSEQPLVRPDTPGNTLLFKFDPGDVVESFPSPGGRFRVHFTRMGSNAVPAADDDASGIPDYVEEVAAVYDEVIDAYEALGFRPPIGDDTIADNGGDGRFDIYLVDFAGSGDGHYSNDACDSTNPQVCAGYMVQENDFAGYGYPSTLIANRIVGSHELFHAVQAAYDIDQGSVMSEGSAVWATEQFDPTLSDFEGFIDGFLENPDRSLDVPLPGPVDPFSYGSGIFFQFLDERFGPGTVRLLWERCENGSDGNADPYWLEEVGAAVAAQEPGATFAGAFTDFAIWNLFLSSNADPAQSYADGAGYAPVRMTDVSLPFEDDKLRVFYASAQYYRAAPGGRAEVTAALVDTGGGMDGIALVLAPHDAGGYQPVVIDDPAAGAQTVGSAAADHVVALVINTNAGGDSLRPALCFGSTDEVALCRETHGGAGGEGGMGAGGSGGDDGAEAGPGDEGCGCRSAGGSAARWPWLLLGAALWIQRRRRRTAQSETSR